MGEKKVKKKIIKVYTIEELTVLFDLLSGKGIQSYSDDKISICFQHRYDYGVALVKNESINPGVPEAMGQ